MLCDAFCDNVTECDQIMSLAAYKKWTKKPKPDKGGKGLGQESAGGLKSKPKKKASDMEDEQGPPPAAATAPLKKTKTPGLSVSWEEYKEDAAEQDPFAAGDDEESPKIDKSQEDLMRAQVCLVLCEFVICCIFCVVPCVRLAIAYVLCAVCFVLCDVCGVSIMCVLCAV
jgi:hypothetical protein